MKTLLRRDAGRAQPFADFALVAVHFRRVDMAITEPQRLLDHPGAGAAAQIPGAEADRRNAGAARYHDRYVHDFRPDKRISLQRNRALKAFTKELERRALLLMPRSATTCLLIA